MVRIAMEPGEVGQPKVYGFGVRFIVKVVEVRPSTGDERVSNGVVGGEEMVPGHSLRPSQHGAVTWLAGR